jgi:hypothetical protein
LTEFQPIRSLGARGAANVAGNAATRIVVASSARSGAIIHNASPTHSLWLRVVEQGAAAPTITSSDRDFVVPPENSLVLDIGPALEVYAQNSSGGATLSPYTATEVLR